jgi:16S rRNA (adenine1518-N6/adenine1519-N6)-dimethyltransferase
MIAMAAPSPERRLIEIGPGPGVLTERLVDSGCPLTVIEKDRDFARLIRRFPVDVIEGDCLDVDYTAFGEADVIGNLPYQITSPLLGKLLSCYGFLRRLTIMVQKEVGERLVAPPGTKGYGLLSVLFAFYGRLVEKFPVSRRCFYPEPDVDSTVLTLELTPPPPVDAETFFTMVRTAFSQRRKMLRRSLAMYKGAEMETARPEELSLTDFLALFERIELR